VKIRPLLILVEFGLITAPLAWWWTQGGLESYYELFKRLAFPLLQELGVGHISPGLVRDRLAGFIPFVALMLVTPQMPLKRRLGGLGLGIVVIFFGHVALSYWAWASFGRTGVSADSMARYFPALIINDAVPFILWAFFANRFLLDRLQKVIPSSRLAPMVVPSEEGAEPRDPIPESPAPGHSGDAQNGEAGERDDVDG
jgi:hypothetical protein